MPDWFGTLFLPSQEFAEKRRSAQFQRHTPPTDWSKTKFAHQFYQHEKSLEEMSGTDPAGIDWSRPGNKRFRDSTPKQQALRAKSVQKLRDAAFGVVCKKTPVLEADVDLVGNHNDKPITLRLGTSVTSTNSIRNMLSHVNGRGHVNSSWFGRITAQKDTRAYFFQHFRHRLYDNGDSSDPNKHADDFGPYDTSTDGHIMWPTAPDLTVGTTNAADAVYASIVGNQPIHTHSSGQETFAPINRPAYEDMSWNLNRMKLQIQGAAHIVETTTDSALTGVNTHDHTFTTERVTGGYHVPTDIETTTLGSLNREFRANSAIAQNNREAVDSSIGKGTNYTYDMVFKSGDVNYLFMNKGDGPIEVELVVYRVKKQSNLIPASFKADRKLKESLTTPVSQGYLEKRLARFGTVNLGGRQPDIDDCLVSPQHPFLPITSQAKQSDIAFREEKRFKFSMDSGSRRPVTLKLGGKVYNPYQQSKQQTGNTSGTYPDGGYTMVHTPYLDEYSYTVAIAVNGVVTSRELSANGVILGDVYSGANLQYYCHYVENIAACSYRPAKDNVQYVNGFMADMGTALKNATKDTDSSASAPVANTGVVMVPQSHQIRMGATHHFNATGEISGTTNAVTTGEVGSGAVDLSASMNEEDMDTGNDS